MIRRRLLVILPLLLCAVCMRPSTAQVNPEVLDRLDRYLTHETRRFHLPDFAFAVTLGERIVHIKTMGKSAADESTFIIGSCSKTITALAALLAFQDAGVDVDTCVDDLISGLQIEPTDPPVTLRHLLQHRSGLTRAQGFTDVPELEEIEQVGFRIQLDHRPGEQFSYCNLNYALLGRAIEKVTGRSYAEYVQDRVFVPAGLTSSNCGTSGATGSGVPEYQYLFGFAREVGKTAVDSSQVPSGFVSCSVRDLARLQLCLMNDGRLDGERIFPAEILQTMKTPAGGSEFGYGMGVGIGFQDGLGRIMAHEGATQTSYAYYGTLIDRGVGIVLLTNINLFDPFSDHGESIYKNAFRILDGKEPNRVWPYRIWFRWLVAAVLCLTIWRFVRSLHRWRRAGRPFSLPTSTRARISLTATIAIPICIWIYLVPRIAQVPLGQLLALEPDVMWTFLVCTALDMVNGVVKVGSGQIRRSWS